jgi:NAD kinase
MTSLAPRVVLVTRQSEYEALLAAHATRGQAEFFLATRGQQIDEIEARHIVQIRAVAEAKRTVPADWSLAEVQREDLDRFLFTANDIVVALGQDGLVANLAKYLAGQPVIGVALDAARNEGVLTPHSLDALHGLLRAVERNAATTEARTMVEAQSSEGTKLTALNELFLGHRSHQSARYLLRHGGEEEFQSSSGVIVSTGTGLSGWARSILAAAAGEAIIAATDPRAIFLAREPWPSRTSGCQLRQGEIAAGSELQLISRINAGGVIFADGIEQDFLGFDWGVRVEVRIANGTLNVVTG